MSGWCSTRANRASVIAPSRPEVIWSTQLPTEVQPLGFAVDPENRIYVTFRPISDGTEFGGGLAAIDPDGGISWTETFDIPLQGAPILDSNGQIVLLRGNAEVRSLVAFDRSGAIVHETPLPLRTRADPAVGADGSLYFLVGGISNPAHVIKLMNDEILWATADLGASPAPLALDSHDNLIVGHSIGTADTWSTRVLKIESDGAILWQHDLVGYLVGGPAIANDDSISVSLAQDELTRALLVTIEPSGAVRRFVDLGVRSPSIAMPLAIGSDNTVVVRARDHAFAVDSDGVVLWEREVHPSLSYGVVITSDGELVLSANSHTGLDLATGVEHWVVHPPHAFYYGGLGCLGAAGAIIGWQHDGSVHLAR